MKQGFQSFIVFIKEEVIGTENSFFAWALLLAVGMIVGTGFYLNSPDASFQGVAGSRESNVNFEYSVEIKSVHVIPGQRVQKGDLLIELDQSELNTQIRQLSATLGKLKAEKSVRDQMNKAVGNISQGLNDDPLLIEIRQLEEEKSHLEKQRSNLYVFAEIDGIVGSVNFKRGEKAPAFSPLVTISPDSPTFVQGFVHEQIQSSVRPGSRVKIASITSTGSAVEGKVVSVGSRFVEMPLRLAPSSAASSGIWGREVTIEVPKDNKLLLGERVQISPNRFSFFYSIAFADQEDYAALERNAALAPIRLPKLLAEKTNFEASGAVYLPDLKKYLVVSDDTDNRDSPWLFLMSEDGEVEETPLEIPGLSEIRDLESVSTDGPYVYAMTSLSSRKSGEVDPARNLFVRMKRDGRVLSETEVVNLGEKLRALIRSSSHPLLKSMVENGIEKLEIEAHAIRDGALFLGIKTPAYPDASSTVILRLADVDGLFSRRNNGALEVWKTFRVSMPDMPAQRITDMLFVGNALYFTTSCLGSTCGGTWRMGLNEMSPILLQKDPQHSPEGLAYNPENNLFLVTFDLGNDGSKFTTFRGPKSAE